MKRFIACSLAILTVLPLFLSGCGVVTKGSDYCVKFIDRIIAREFSDAFDMLPDSMKVADVPLTREEKKALKEQASGTASPDAADTSAPSPTPEPEDTTAPGDVVPEGTESRDMGAEGAEHPFNGGTPLPETAAPSPTDTPKPTPKPKATPTPTPTPSPTPTPEYDENGDPIIPKIIARNDFIKKYESVFDELQLKGVDYEITDVTDGEIISIVKYNMTYHSERGGDLTYAFEITANRIEHRWTIAWSPNLIFPMMDWGDNVRVGILQANRGEILCNGEAYAQNVNIITVFAVPSSIVSAAETAAKDAGLEVMPTVDEAYAAFAKQVAAIPELEVTEEDILKQLRRQINDFAKLKTFFPDQMNPSLMATILAVKGLAVDSANYGTQRYYPFGESLCHIVGYAGIITKEKKLEYERIGDTRYNGDSWVGNYGLELVYEDTLLGTNGRFTYIQDPKGGSKGMLYKTDAIDGKDLHLTILPELQERLEDVVDTTIYDTTIHGAVVVLNPKTGAIQAIRSFPGFDLNYLARGMPEEEWEALKTHPDIPLYNRVTQGLYTPGSVFKTMTAAALLETNTMTISDVFPAAEQEHIDIDAWYPSDEFMNAMLDRSDNGSWKEQSVDRPLRRTNNTNRHTPMNMFNSIIDSDNLYFAYGAMKLGWKKYEAYLQKLGWTEPLELEVQKGLIDEATGVDKRLETSTPQIYDVTKRQNDYDLAVTGYGQGQIMVSPLQMACFVSAYANGGDVMQPYVVDSIWHASGTDYTLIEQKEPKVWKHLIEPSTVDTVIPALRLVTTEGTARSLNKSFISKRIFNLGYNFAGKTGTAEITDDKTKELAWFVCWRDTYADTGEPVSDEDARLICIMLEVNLPMGLEWSQMKYDIARALLKDDVLNDG